MNRKIADPPHPIPKYFSNEYSNENALLALGQFVTLFRAGLNLLNSRWWWYFLSLIQLVCNQWCMKNVNIFVEMPQEQDLWFRNFVEPPKSKAKWTTNFNSWHPMDYRFRSLQTSLVGSENCWFQWRIGIFARKKTKNWNFLLFFFCKKYLAIFSKNKKSNNIIIKFN